MNISALQKIPLKMKLLLVLNMTTLRRRSNHRYDRNPCGFVIYLHSNIPQSSVGTTQGYTFHLWGVGGGMI